MAPARAPRQPILRPTSEPAIRRIVAHEHRFFDPRRRIKPHERRKFQELTIQSSERGTSPRKRRPPARDPITHPPARITCHRQTPRTPPCPVRRAPYLTHQRIGGAETPTGSPIGASASCIDRPSGGGRCGVACPSGVPGVRRWLGLGLVADGGRREACQNGARKILWGVGGWR